MSLFQTQANTDFNSFQDPLNPFNTNRGAWNIDPTYLTPSYAAPYRPQYQGPTGAPPPNYNVGFFKSAYGVASPTAPTFMYGDTINQEDPYYSALGYRPGDSAMWGAQRAILPALAFTAAMKASQMPMQSNSKVYSWVSQNARMLGGQAPSAARHAATMQMGLGAHVGSNIGGGLARGITGGMGAFGVGGGAGSAAFVGAARGIGAAAGSLAFPLMAAQGALEVADAAIFDPYSATRNTERGLRQNFANIYAGNGAQGNVLGGAGMNRKTANSIASSMTQSSIKDMTFDTYGMQDLTDFASRAGMLDNAQIGQIESKMKAIAKQVKVMMRVANEPDFRAAMSMLGELKVAGASEGVVGRVLQNIGGSSAIAGISSQQMMNTVGMQGQYLYQSNSLTPYIGQTNAAASYGTFAAAYRMGTISDATLARYGGREGITQLSMSGQVNAADTPYNRISMMNEYMGGGKGSGVVGNLAKFGQSVASDPMAATGAFEMYGHEMMSRQLMEKGSGAVLGQLGDIGGVIPGMKNANGSIDVEKAYLLLTRQMGIPGDEAKAMLKELYAYKDPKVRMQQMTALRGNTVKDTMKALEQEGMGYGALNPMVHGIRSGWKDFKAGGARLAGDFSSLGAGMGDAAQAGIGGLRFGSLVNGQDASSLGEFMGGEGSNSYALNVGGSAAMRGFDRVTEMGPARALKDVYSWATGNELMPDNGREMEAINQAALSGDKDAQIVVDPKSSPEAKAKAIDNMGFKGKLGAEFSPAKAKSLLREISVMGSKKVSGKATTSAGKISSGLKAALGKDVGMLEGIGLIDAASRVAMGDESGMAAMKSAYGDMSKMELKEKASNIVKSAAENNVYHLTAAMGGKSSDDIVKAATSGSTEEFGPYAKEAQKEIAKIRGNKDLSTADKKKKIEEVAAFYRLKNRNVSQSALTEGKNLPSGVSAETIVGIHENLKETADKAQQINSLAAQGVINFDTQYSSLASINLTAAVDKFGSSVGDFEKAVKSLKGDTEETSMWNSVTSMFGGNEKPL